MKIYEILGLARSGHHAMTNWVIKNLCGADCDMNYKLNIMPNRQLYYINEGNLDKDLTFQYINDHKDHMRSLLISYENCNYDYSVLAENETYNSPLSIIHPDVFYFTENKRIIFIRDFYNNLASRIQNNLVAEHKWSIGVDFINMWKNHAQAILDDKAIGLKYEDWMTDKDIRNKVMNQIMGCNEFHDHKVRGTNSSFSPTDTAYTNRINQVDVPEETKQLIQDDNELHYLIGKLNYQYIQL